MRSLLILSGIPASGKSSFVKEHGLECYTLSPDTIRLMLSSPVQGPDGRLGINQAVSKQAFELMFKLLEERMAKGAFSVIDATHTKAKDYKQYKTLCEKYKYRAYVVDFSDVSLEEAKRRNSLREELKIVPEDVLDRMYSAIKELKFPGWCKILKPKDNLLDAIGYKVQDFNQYKKIHVLGDIHGCIEPLKEYFKDGVKPDELYIFVGDFIDRGLNNAEVLEFMFTIMELPNVIMLEGNHEIHLWRWATGETSFSNEFNDITRPELETKNVDKSKIRQLYRRLQQCCLYHYDDKLVLVTHGGLASIPSDPRELVFIPTSQLIKGVGTYDNIPYETFDRVSKGLTDSSTSYRVQYQIHGHRNTKDYPVKASERGYNLEQKVEFGGYFSAVTLDKDGFEEILVKNTVYKSSEGKDHSSEFVNDSLLIELRNNQNVKEKRLSGDISSFNFTRKTFTKALWDAQTIKARGLFINTKTTEVVARSWVKSFNISELENTSIDDLKDKFQYPVTASVKYNGFLGLVGYDSASDEIIITSKSTTDGDFVGFFKNIFYRVFDVESIKYIKQYVKTHNVTLVFEVIDPVNDPHIIKYDKSDLVLLDAVKRTIVYEKEPYDMLKELSERIGSSERTGTKYREIQAYIHTPEQLLAWYQEVMDPTYKYMGEPIEGFMLEDSSGYMVKVKLPYYTMWKAARGLVLRKRNGKPAVGHHAFEYPEMEDFYAWLKAMPNHYLDKDIIDLRECYYEHKEIERRQKESLY
jgi:predicted kinase